jgi:hypothetical protein
VKFFGVDRAIAGRVRPPKFASSIPSPATTFVEGLTPGCNLSSGKANLQRPDDATYARAPLIP